MGWTLRTGRLSDAGSVLLLWADSDAEPTRTDDVPSLRRLIARDPAALIVAEEDGRLVGSVIAGWDGWRGSVYRLVVAPSHRRRGLGRRLLAEAQSWLAAAGCRAADRSRPRSSLIRGDVRTPPPGGETTGDHGTLRQRNIVAPAGSGWYRIAADWRALAVVHVMAMPARKRLICVCGGRRAEVF